MSSTLTCHFQAPVHAAAHMYEMEPQQPYSNSGYLSDSRSPADASDVDSSSSGFYDEAGYNCLPSRFGSSQFEDAEAAFRYNRMRNENLNNPNMSPQLLCPRPTLPPSQYSPQFSWSDWPSEPPISPYQTYSEHTSSIPHHPHAAESGMQHSFQSQQGVMSTPSKFYPAFMETVPGQTSNSSRDGYAQHPFLASSFEHDPTYSTSHSRYYAAHQPIPPEKRSSYSELAPNITFMNGQAQLSPVPPTHIPDFAKPKDKSDDTKPKKSPYALDLSGPPLTSIGRKYPLPTTVSMPLNAGPSNPVVVDAPAPKATRSKSKSKTRTSSSSRSVNEPRRPSLACTFCRERKIACGRPPNGSPDPTCNQCARRSFRCRYLDLKSTSSLVRSRASSKVPSSSPRHK